MLNETKESFEPKSRKVLRFSFLTKFLYEGSNLVQYQCSSTKDQIFKYYIVPGTKRKLQKQHKKITTIRLRVNDINMATSIIITTAARIRTRSTSRIRVRRISLASIKIILSNQLSPKILSLLGQNRIILPLYLIPTNTGRKLSQSKPNSTQCI